jgi:hypothetical protein
MEERMAETKRRLAAVAEQLKKLFFDESVPNKREISDAKRNVEVVIYDSTPLTEDYLAELSQRARYAEEAVAHAVELTQPWSAH